MSTATVPKIATLVPWFGSNRMLAEHVGAALKGCTWVGVPFMGGGSELAHIDARTIVANDLHRGVINLARTESHTELGRELRRRLKCLPFHADVLAQAQIRCRAREAVSRPHPDEFPDLEFAVDYFVCCWMGRSAKSGTDDEFSGSLPVRWSAGGGDSAVRYRSAVHSLRPWKRVLSRCNFLCMDCFEFLDACKDADGHGIYCDAPWPTDGEAYRHKFTEEHQRRLAARLAEFKSSRVVVRYGDHPLIRELYPVAKWRWTEFAGRTSANKAKAEVLLTNDREQMLF